MVRKPTLILLIVFALLIGLMFYLQKNPLPSRASLTPSPTLRAQIVPNLEQGDITAISFAEKGSADIIQVKKNEQGEWVVGAEGKQKADAGKVEQARAEIAALTVITEMPEELEDSAVGLKEPTYTLTIQTAQDQKYEIQVGDKTPIENGYYAKVENGSAVVLNNNAIDTIVRLMKEIGAPQQTPTPLETIPPAP